MRLGNGRFESTVFNSRLQPTQIALGTSTNNTSLLKLNYDYGNTDNNGNVKSQTITVPGMSHPLVQTYQYDQLNRITSAEEKSNNVTQWKQTFTFDRYGNRRFDMTNTTVPDSQSNQNITNPQIDVSNNRFSANQGYDYDQSGNVTKDATDKRFAYDAENKQTSFGTNGSSTNGGSYFYDGDGRRVKKIVGTETTIFVYNASGQLVAEYTTTAPTNPQISYLTTDTLGSPRINADANGQVTARHDYMPFGEEIASGTGGRNSAQGYGGEDNIRQKFTQYERDSETNLEYAKARYYSYTHGRFTSIDPLMGNTLDPQSLNRYTYVLNDPLNQRDPDGLYPRSQHRFITFLMAAMLGVPNADAIGRGAGDRDNFWNVAFPFVWNFNKHFGRPKSPEQLDSYEGYKLGEELHLVEDNAPGGPHQLAGCDGGATNGCYGLGDRLLSALIHGAREIFGDSPDKSPDRQDGWEAAWDILRHHAPKNRQSTPYPKEVIRFITTFLNRHNLTIVGMQYISPDGSIQSSGVMLDPSRHRLISSSNINGVIVNIYEEIPKEKKPKEPKKSPKDKP